MKFMLWSEGFMVCSRAPQVGRRRLQSQGYTNITRSLQIKGLTCQFLGISPPRFLSSNSNKAAIKLCHAKPGDYPHGYNSQKVDGATSQFKPVVPINCCEKLLESDLPASPPPRLPASPPPRLPTRAETSIERLSTRGAELGGNHRRRIPEVRVRSHGCLRVPPELTFHSLLLSFSPSITFHHLSAFPSLASLRFAPAPMAHVQTKLMKQHPIGLDVAR